MDCDLKYLKQINYVSGSQPVGLDPLGGQMAFSHGSPKAMEKHRYFY